MLSSWPRWLTALLIRSIAHANHSTSLVRLSPPAMNFIGISTGDTSRLPNGSSVPPIGKSAKNRERRVMVAPSRAKLASWQHCADERKQYITLYSWQLGVFLQS